MQHGALQTVYHAVKCMIRLLFSEDTIKRNLGACLYCICFLIYGGVAGNNYTYISSVEMDPHLIHIPSASVQFTNLSTQDIIQSYTTNIYSKCT